MAAPTWHGLMDVLVEENEDGNEIWTEEQALLAIISMFTVQTGIFLFLIFIGHAVAQLSLGISPFLPERTVEYLSESVDAEGHIVTLVRVCIPKGC